MKFSSKILENAVEALATLPSVGRKTALRLALHLINDKTDKSQRIAQALVGLKEGIKYCKVCHNFSDEDICEICNDPHRNKKLLCVVESVRDVMAIEDTQQFSGLYHILGGVISPMEGVGPEELNIDSLKQKILQNNVTELIMAISPTIEGDTTIYYLSKVLSDMDVTISTIARGVSFGGELEYADEFTLGKSILSRIPYQKS